MFENLGDKLVGAGTTSSSDIKVLSCYSKEQKSCGRELEYGRKQEDESSRRGYFMGQGIKANGRVYTLD